MQAAVKKTVKKETSSYWPLAQTPLLEMPNTGEYNSVSDFTRQDSSTTVALLFPLVCLPAGTQM